MTRPYRVLYAEDEPSNRKFMELALRRQGMDVDLAANGDDAFRLFSNNEYDVIILDWYMPGMNGDALARLIRSHNVEVGLVALTSNDLAPDILSGCGFDEILVKPLVGTDYLERILNLAQRRRTV